MEYKSINHDLRVPYSDCDPKAMQKLIDTIESDSVLKKTSLLKVEDLGDEFSIKFQKVSLKNNTNAPVGDESFVDYCVNGLMYNNSSMMFYLSPSKKSVFVPLFLAYELIFQVFNEVTGSNVNSKALKYDVDMCLQHMKFNGGNAGLINELVASKPKYEMYNTIITTLIRSRMAKDSDNVNELDKKTYVQFEKLLTKTILTMVDSTTRAFSSLNPSFDNPDSEAFASTIITSKQLVKVLDSKEWSEIVFRTSESGLTSDLSTNPLFSSSARSNLARVLDSKAKKGIVNKEWKNYESAMKLLNAVDMVNEDFKANLLNSFVSTAYSTSENLANDITDITFTRGAGQILRAKQVTAGLDSLIGIRTNVSALSDIIDSVEEDDDSFIDLELINVSSKSLKSLVFALRVLC